MRKPASAKAPSASGTAHYRHRAALARDAAGRFIRRSVDVETPPDPPIPSELAQACDQAIVDWNAIQPASRAEDWGDEQLDETLNDYDAVFKRAIDEPSRDVADIQAKSRLLLHDLIAHTTGYDPSDETTLSVDDRLTRVVLREIAALPAASADAEDGPATVEEMATLDFAAYTLDTPTRDPNGWMGEFAHHAIGMHIADRTLRMSKTELAAFIRKGGERDADTPAIMLQALNAAQKTLEGWGKLLSLACTRYMVAASSEVLAQEGAADGAVWADPGPETPSDDERSAGFNLVDQIDFASASLEELQTLHDLADRVGAFAYALVWTGRCKTHSGDFNAAGELMQWLGDALTDVESAANDEARRRRPTTACDRETRLEMLARPTIQNGDPDQIEAFALELVGHATLERKGH